MSAGKLSEVGAKRIEMPDWSDIAAPIAFRNDTAHGGTGLRSS
jgi:hypothetical protein